MIRAWARFAEAPPLSRTDSPWGAAEVAALVFNRGPTHPRRENSLRQNLWFRFVAVTILAASALVSAACASMTINRVLADPSRYRNREIRLSGAVVDSYSLANRGAYRIDDDTGQLWVLSDNGTPRKGARVTVKGTIREGFNLGSLGDRINLPAGVGSGLVLMEYSNKAK